MTRAGSHGRDSGGHDAHAAGGDRATPGSGLAPGAVTPAAPCAGVELELLHQAGHLNRADIYHKLASL